MTDEKELITDTENKESDLRFSINVCQSDLKRDIVSGKDASVNSFKSSFFIETYQTVILFDWYSTSYPVFDSKKEVYCLFSNSFLTLVHDHFIRLINKVKPKGIFIYDKCGSGVIEGNERKVIDNALLLEQMEQSNQKDDLFSNKPDIKILSDKTEYASFIVKVDGLTFFYDAGSRFIARGAYFNEYLEPLRGMVIDYAMLPLDSDYRGSWKKLNYILNIADIKRFSPSYYYWSDYEYIKNYILKNPVSSKRMIAFNLDSALEVQAHGELGKILELTLVDDNSDIPKIDQKQDNIRLNTRKDHPLIGDETRFIRIREAGTNDELTDNITLVPDKVYDIFIIYDNSSERGIAEDVRVRAVREDNKITAEILCSNADKESIKSSLMINYDLQNFDLLFDFEDAKILSKWPISGMSLDSGKIFGEEGVMVGVREADGKLIAGLDYSGYIIFQVSIVKKNKKELNNNEDNSGNDEKNNHDETETFLSDAPSELKALIAEAAAFYKKNEKLSGIKCYQKAIAICRKMFDEDAESKAVAARMIGLFYEKGYGVLKNLPEASEWYKKAAALGDKRSMEKLENI